MASWNLKVALFAVCCACTVHKSTGTLPLNSTLIIKTTISSNTSTGNQTAQWPTQWIFPPLAPIPNLTPLTFAPQPLKFPLIPTTGGGAAQNLTTPVCPDEYCYKDGVCVKQTPVPKGAECTADATEVNGACVVYVTAMQKCAPGCILRGVFCVCPTTSRPKQYCPDGTEPSEADGCVIKYPAKFECPDGTAPFDDKCATVVSATQKCPPFYTLQGGVCAKAETSLPLVSACPNNGVFDGVNCATTTYLKKVCPPGATDIGNEKCAIFEDPNFTCPPGYIQNNKLCQRVATVPKQSFCANGGDASQNCLKIIPAPLTPYCSNGALVGQVCMVVKQNPVQYICPQSYVPSNVTGECIKDISYDCSKTEWTVECNELPVCEDTKVTGKCVPVCDEKAKASNTACLPLCTDTITTDCIMKKETPQTSGNLRQLTIPLPKLSLPKISYTVKHADPLPLCHKVPVVTPGTCKKHIAATASPVCVEGVYRGGSTCDVTTYTPPQTKCDATTDEGGNCIFKETAALVVGCLPSYTAGVDNNCTKLETVSAQITCKDGSTNIETCSTIVPKVCPNGGDCKTIIVQSAILSCPAGFIKSVAADGNVVCTKIVYQELTLSCPEGSVALDNFTCAIFVEKLPRGEVSKQVASQVVCDLSHVQTTEGCIKEERFMPEIVCPAGTYPIDQFHCGLVKPKQIGCPVGSVPDGDQCYVQQVLMPMIVDTVKKE